MQYLYSNLPPVRFAGKKLVGRVVFGLLVLMAALAGAVGGLLIVYSTDLPEVGELERYRPSAITELYDDQGRVIASFALQRRVVATYDDFPQVLRDSVISIEDKEFESHWGVNFWRVLGAAWRNLRSGHNAQGASTLTMQLSRNLFLSPERSYSRKFQEVMLSIQIERRFTKPQIFTLYANQIYLGHGVYGFEAASQFYFSKHAKELTLEEAALLAGLPKSPEGLSPINYPERAIRRRNIVLDSLLEDGKITAEQADRAKNSPIKLEIQNPSNSIAPYFAEEIRRYLEKKYGASEVHQGGLRVYTSLNLEWQKAANRVVVEGLAGYERRHGWKGGLKNVVLAGQRVKTYQHPDWIEPLEAGSYVHALVTDSTSVLAIVKFGRYSAPITAAEMKWTGHKSPQEIMAVGDIVYVRIESLDPPENAKISLEQDSGAQGALLALDNATGDIKAMVGGRDFDTSQFNRSTQALRQAGSSFKPYVYTAVIDGGASPEDVILDAPVTFMTSSGPYAPHNYDNRFEGTITLRRALAQSRNIPALKLADRVGIRTVIEYTRRFGITSPLLPYLPVALGAADVTLYEQTAAFTTFPNDGVRVIPRYIRKVTDYDGRVLEENYPEVKDVVSSRTARIMTSMLREVVQHGTAARAGAELKYPLGGKTGTTNDFTDAWFIGFSPSLTCGVWIGFDEKKTLGKSETGGHTALPLWIAFMKTALQGHEPEDFGPAPEVPPTAVAQKVDTPDQTPGDGETPH
ncbi:MAG TPA: PBP1A family penicillin-binding protein [Terriglobales bacterium]|nr:PBP1A family penicillin-binding protein [Terriglobales bacterium]